MIKQFKSQDILHQERRDFTGDKMGKCVSILIKNTVIKFYITIYSKNPLRKITTTFLILDWSLRKIVAIQTQTLLSIVVNEFMRLLQAQLISDKENIYLVLISHGNWYNFLANFNINAKTILQTIKPGVQVFKKQYILTSKTYILIRC